jgi:hypothetical protein
LSDARIAALVWPLPQPVELHIPLAHDKAFIVLAVARSRPSAAQLLRLAEHFKRPTVAYQPLPYGWRAWW